VTRRTAALRFNASDVDAEGRIKPANYAANEAQVMSAVLDALARHPKVAWRRRINSGFFMLDDRPFRSGFVGCSDIIGQTRIAWGGRFIACECKSRTGTLTEAQEAFLEVVRAAGGIAFVARSVDDVFREIPL
jgi:hypothetical protein